jgi:hypothetical protein
MARLLNRLVDFDCKLFDRVAHPHAPALDRSSDGEGEA